MLSLLPSVVAVGSILGHGYFWVAIVNRIHGWNGPRRLVDSITLFCLVCFLTLPVVVIWQWWELGRDFLSTTKVTPISFFSWSYVVVCTFIGYGNVLARLLGDRVEDHPAVLVQKRQEFVTPDQPFGTRPFRGWYPRLVGAIPLNETLELAVDQKTLLIPQLPEKLCGFRIAHISDLHLTGRIGPEWFHYVVDQVNRLSADAIALTGDLLENEACRSWLIESVGRLQARGGVYFVLGNHDLFVDSERTIAELVEAGLVYVGGTCLETTWNETPVGIAGNERPWANALPKFPADSHAGAFRLGLLHTPDQIDWAQRAGIHLALAGHTHGGQVRFPLLGAVAAPSLYGTRFACGTFLQGETVMHVTRGLSGETPLRWNCPPEIAVLELVARKRG